MRSPGVRQVLQPEQSKETGQELRESFCDFPALEVQGFRKVPPIPSISPAHSEHAGYAEKRTPGDLEEGTDREAFANRSSRRFEKSSANEANMFSSKGQYRTVGSC